MALLLERDDIAVKLSNILLGIKRFFNKRFEERRPHDAFLRKYEKSKKDKPD